MATPIDIVHDLQMFMLSWSREFEHFSIMKEYLNKKYNIKDIDSCDEYYYFFSLNGIKYSWNWLSEELYFNGHEEDENSIISGPAYEYMREYDKAISTAYKNIEREMEYRGWMYDHDEYCHNLFKDGWVTDLSYWSGGCDFDDAVGEFYYEGDE
jgi:hypothetical protein